MTATQTLVDHAHTLHADALVITSHDHLLDVESLLQMREGGLDAKVCMLQADVLTWDEEGPDSSLRSIYSYEGWARRALGKIEDMLEIVEAHPDRFLLVRRAVDIVEGHRTGRAGIIFGLEGARPLEGELSLLRVLHRLGLRHLQLTWSFGNQVCDRVSPPPGPLTWNNYQGTRTPGITEFGRAVIAEANRLGIVLDPGHCSPQTFYELLDLTTQPIVIGHATCRDAGKNAGDITDDQLRALAANGGVLGLHFFSHYLRDRSATVDDLVDHVLHVAEVAGIDHVGLGPDWLPINEKFLRVHDSFAGLPLGQSRPPDRPLGPLAELNEIRKLPRVTECLVQRGFTDDDIRKVLGGNLLRVYRQVWDG